MPAEVLPETTAPDEGRVLGFWAAVSIVMGSMIGSGVFLLPASLAAYQGLSLIGWIISAAGSVMLALVFARLARQLPAAGGPYAYTRQAFGDVPGFLVAWGYWLSIVGTLAALAVAGVGYLDPFIPGIVRSPLPAATLAVAMIWLVIAANIAGAGVAGRIQIVTTALKLLPLIVVAIGGMFFVRADVFALPPPGATPVSSQIVAVVTLTLWAFLGLECATIPAGSVRDPERTIPLATLVGTIAAAAVYLVSTVGVMSLVGPDALASSTAPFADGARRLLGEGGARLVAVGAAISCFGSLNGWTLVAGHLPVAVAADRLFPPFFGTLSSRGTPARGMIVAGLLATVLVAMNYSRGLVALFTFIILLCTLSTLVPYAFCALAVWLMPGQPAPRGAPAMVSALAFVYALFAIGGAGADTVFYGFLLLLAGLPLYVWVRVYATVNGMSGMNEYAPIGRVAVRHARQVFGQARRIDEWRALNFTAPPEPDLAAEQSDAFNALLQEVGAAIVELPALDHLTLDAIYARDASVVTPAGVVLCSMGKAARRSEPAAQGEAFRASGIDVIGAIEPPGTLEGGDVVWFDERTVAVGHGYRTNGEGIRQFREYLGPDVDLIVVPLPHYRGPEDVFHLMSILSPVDHNLAVVYSPLMPVVFRAWLLGLGMRLVEVPDEEFDSMGANVLALAPRRALMLDDNPVTRARLEAAGAEVLTYDGSEISVKGGGGPTCLTRPLSRGGQS